MKERLPPIPHPLPKRVVQVLISVAVWDCGNPDHKHRRRGVAERCLEKERSRRERGATRNKWGMDDYEQILRWRDQDGLIFKEIGRRMGISLTRARQLYRKAGRLAYDDKIMAADKHRFRIFTKSSTLERGEKS